MQISQIVCLSFGFRNSQDLYNLINGKVHKKNTETANRDAKKKKVELLHASTGHQTFWKGGTICAAKSNSLFMLENQLTWLFSNPVSHLGRMCIIFCHFFHKDKQTCTLSDKPFSCVYPNQWARSAEGVERENILFVSLVFVILLP